MLSEIKELIEPDNQWEKLQSIALIESVRIVKGKTSIETRYRDLNKKHELNKL